VPTSKDCATGKVDVNRFASGAALAALTLLASLPALPASAAPVTLFATNIDPLPGERIDVTGDGDDCPADASGVLGTFTATLTYTTPAGTTANVVATGTVAADGTFSSSVTLPENAVSDEPASVVAAITCSGVETASNRVSLSVLYHTGTLTLSSQTVAAGGTLTASGTGCYGGEYVVVYGTAGGDPNGFTNGSSGTPKADRSFTTTLTVPPATARGAYDVYALCPGTSYVEQRVAVTAAAAGAPAPSATTTTLPTVAPVTVATWGGGFTGTGGGTTSGSSTTTTPVATAPVAVAGEAAFTG
jgi:hypothetical protein